MKFNELTVQFDAQDLAFAEELICDIFFSFNLKGVICNIPLDEPDEGFGTNTLPKPEEYSITGFLPLLDSSDIIIEKLTQKLEALHKFNITVNIGTRIVDEKNWADAWKDYFEVTKITNRITIKPDWKDHSPTANELVIHLDPGMAFGTGTHPTTAMCIQMIEHHLKPGASFLDVGTGSGILMIAAKKLGAGSMMGIDTDEVAIQVTEQNLEKNNIPGNDYSLVCTTLDKTDKTPYRMIAANIIAQVIVEILPQIVLRMTDESVTILSGIIKERLPDVTSALKVNRLHVKQEQYTDEWVALAVKKDPEGVSRP